MTSNPDVRRALSYALEALRAHQYNRQHWRYHPKANPIRNNPYYWLKLGWEANGFEGAFSDLPKVLRPFVDQADLTLWWREGRSRMEMVGLFERGIESLTLEEVA